MSDGELTPDELNFLRQGDIQNDEVRSRPMVRPLPALASVPDRAATEEPEAEAEDDAAVPDSLRSLFEEYCHGLAIGLGRLLRAEVTVQVRALHQTVYERFAAAVNNPTCLQVIDAPAWAGKLLLELQPSVAFPLLDRLLGGGQLPPPVLRRALTEIEARLVQRITREFSQQFVKVWPLDTGLELIPEQLLSQVGQLRGESPRAPLLVARLEVSWDEVRGGVQLALPGSVAARLSPES